MISIQDLITPVTYTEAKASIYEALAVVGVDATMWKPLGVYRTLVAAVAVLFSVSSTVGSVLDLIGQNAKSATITSDAIWEWATPPTYIAGQNLTVTVNAVAAGTGTNGASTIGVSAYGINNTGTFTSNIGPATQNLGTVAADYAFVITGTSLTVTEKLLFDLQTKVIENGGANNLNAQINSIRVG